MTFEDTATGMYTTFGGADVVMYVGGQAIGEVQSIKWTENFAIQRGNDLRVAGIMEVVLFNEDGTHRLDAYEKQYNNPFADPTNITLIFADEYGNSAYLEIKGVNFQGEATEISINKIFFGKEAEFTATDITPLTKATWGEIIERFPFADCSNTEEEC